MTDREDFGFTEFIILVIICAVSFAFVGGELIAWKNSTYEQGRAAGVLEGISEACGYIEPPMLPSTYFYCTRNGWDDL